MSTSRLVFVLIVLACAYFYANQESDARVVQGNGDYTYVGYEIRELEPYTLKGRVLSRKNYRTGRESDLSPTDLAMGWGEMQNKEILDALEISQRNRWVFWRAETLPLPRHQLTSQMANVHIIPANESVAADLKRIEQDDVVRLHGSLVEAVAKDGWRWRSSLSRTDTGDGSCELMWLEHIETTI